MQVERATDFKMATVHCSKIKNLTTIFIKAMFYKYKLIL